MAKFLVEILLSASGEPQAKAAFDSVGSSAQASAKNVEAASIRSEASLRRITEAAAKLSSQMSDTRASKALISDYDNLNRKLAEQLNAYKRGAESLAEYARKEQQAAESKRILIAQVKAGVSADSEAGKKIAEQITLYSKLDAELQKIKRDQPKSSISSAPGLDSLLSRIGGSTGEGGQIITELTSKVTTLTEKWHALVEETGSSGAAISKLLGDFKPLLPILAEVAVAAIAAGAAWKSFEFIEDAIKEGMKAQEVVIALNQTLRQNGTTSGLSARQMQEYAESLVSVTAVDDDVILKSEMLLSRFDKLGREGFKKAERFALDYVATGKSVDEASETIGKAVAGNTKTFFQLAAELGGPLDKAQKANIQQMVESGHTAEYQAIVFQLLEDKIGGLAEAHAKTLAGSIKIANTVMSEFRKGIASELIPVLEDLASGLVSSLAPAGSGWKSGWDRIRAVASSAGHDVGESISGMIYGIRLSYEEWQVDANTLWVDLSDTYKSIVDLVLGSAVKIAEGIGKIPGIGIPYKLAADQIRAVQADIDRSLTTTAIDARKSANEHIQSIARIITEIQAHRQALEADDEEHKKLGNSTDEIAQKNKDLQGILEEVKKTLQEYADKIKDLEDKQRHQAGAQEYLAEALSHGLVAYNQARVEQERSKAITDELTEAYRAHRSEIEKLTDERDKLTHAGQTVAASAVQAQIDAETRSYANQATQIGINAGRIFDLTQANKVNAQGAQETLNLENQLAIERAKLIDLTTRTSTASHALALSLAEEKDKLTLLTPADQLRLSILRLLIEDTQRLSVVQRITNQALDETENVRASVQDWEAQRQAALNYGKSIAGILQQFGLLSKASQQRQIDTKVQQALEQGATAEEAANLRRTLEAQQEIVNGLHAIQAQTLIAEKDYIEFAESLAQNYSGIFSDFVKTGKISLDDFEKATIDAFASTASKVIGDWLSQWFEAMAEWLARWIATQAAAKAAQAELGSGSSSGNRSSWLSLLSTAYKAYGAYAGGAAGYSPSGGVLAGWQGGVGSNGGGSFSSGAGSGAAGASVFAAFALAALDWLKTKGTPWAQSNIQFGGAQGLTIGSASGSQGGATSRDAKRNVGEALSAANDIILGVQAWIASIGGALDRAQKVAEGQLSIQKHGQGGSTDWIVTTFSGQIVHFGKDVKAAEEFAVLDAIRHTPIVGVSDEVKTALKNSIATSLDALNQDIAVGTAAFRDRIGSAGSQTYDTIAKYQDEIDAEKRLGIAIENTIAARNREIEAQKYQAIGLDTSISDQLAMILSINKGIEESARTVTKNVQSILGSTVDEAQQYLAKYQDLLSQYHLQKGTPPGKNGGEGIPAQWVDAAGNVADDATQAILKKLGPLKNALDEYAKELGELPDKISQEQISATIFNDLFRFVSSNTELAAKYEADRVRYAQLLVNLQFQLIKIQLQALGAWEQFAGLWQDALDAALKNAATPPSASSPSSRRGGSSGPSIADQQATLRAQIATLQAQAQGSVRAAFYELQKQIADFTESAKKAKLPASELAQAIDLMTEKFHADLRKQADAYAGFSDSFTQKVGEVVDFFKQLQDLGRAKTGIPNWLLDLMRGKAISQLGAQLDTSIDQFAGTSDPLAGARQQAQTLFQDLAVYAKAAGLTAAQIQAEVDRINRGLEHQIAQIGKQLSASIDQFAGLVDPMQAVNDQAESLRQSVIAYGKSAGWTAEQIQAALDKINRGVDFQRTSAINGIMDTLFGYLKDDAKFASQAAELKKKEVELQFALIEAQLKALNAWDAETQRIFEAAKHAAETIDNAVSNIIYPDVSGQSGQDYYQRLADAMNSAVQAWRSGIQQFTQQTQAILTNPQLSGLTADQQLQTAKGQFADLIAKARGGDTSALSQLDQVRQTLLQLGRSQYGGGQGYESLYEWAMGLSADLLANAQQGELSAQQLAAQTVTANASQNTQTLATAIYDAARQVANAVYASFSGIPHYAQGGIALHPHLALVGDGGPEVIIPMRNLEGPRGSSLTNPVLSARVLAFRYPGDTARVDGAQGGQGSGSSSSGGSDARMMVDRLSGMESHLRDIADSARQTARSNDAMVKAERIRTTVNRRKS